MPQRMTDAEKRQGLKDILGVEDQDIPGAKRGYGAREEEDNGLVFSDAAQRDYDTGYVAEPDPDEEEDEAEEGTEATTTKAQDDTPPWAKAMLSTAQTAAEEARAVRQEWHTRDQYARQEQERAQREAYYRQQQELQQQAQPEEEYFLTSQDMRAMEQKRLQDMQFVARVAMNQEYQSFRNGVEALRSELENDKDMPKLNEVIPDQVLGQLFNEYSKNPNFYGGLGRNWKQEIGRMYQEHSQPILRQRLKDQQAKNDEIAKKRDQKQQEQKKNLSKVARSGAATQEPKQRYQRGVRSYKDIRGQALRFIQES